MKIQRATFLGIRGIADLTLDFTDPRTGRAHDVVLVTGPSASGKTRLLEAILAAKEAIGAYGSAPSGAGWVGAPGGAAKVGLTFQLSDAEQAYAGTTSHTATCEVFFTADRVRSEAEEGIRATLERYSHNPAQGKLEYFPASRRITAHAPFGGLGVAEQRVLRAGKDPRKYSFIVPLLRAIEQDPPAAAALAEKLEALSPTCRYVPGVSGGLGLGSAGTTGAVPRCLTSRGGPRVAPADLSDSEADALIFAATAVAIGLSHSIVLVDRPDLYLEEGRILALRALGEENQMFLATRSVPAGAAAEARVVTLQG